MENSGEFMEKMEEGINFLRQCLLYGQSAAEVRCLFVRPMCHSSEFTSKINGTVKAIVSVVQIMFEVCEHGYVSVSH